MKKKLQVKASRTMMDFVFKDFFGVASQTRSRKFKGVKIPFEMDELIASIGHFQKVSKTGI